MKKIFYIANIRLPTERAHGIQIMKTCEAFVKNGSDVTLIVPHRFNKIKADPFVYYGVKPQFSIVRVPTIDLVRFGKIGFFIGTIFFSECVVWYIRLQRQKEKIIYSRDVWPLINTSFLGWKLFWEAHMGSRSFLTRKLLKRLTGLITITNGLKNLYEHLGIAAGRIFVAPDAVDLNDFNVSVSRAESREKLSLPSDKKIAIYIGLLDAWKGYRTLLEASKLIQDNTILIVIIGGTDTQVSELRKEYSQVRFLGYQEYSALPVNQKSADVLVIPNSAKYPISKYFTSPLKLFAHMASGVPIVAADLPSIREIVDESDVVFFAPDDPVDLAKKITLTLSDSKATERAMHAKGKASLYSWDNRGKNIIDFMNKHV